jgi:hypothetical protein
MRFVTPQLEAEFEHLHKDVRELLLDLDAWSARENIPGVVVTHVFRTPEKQHAIYGGLKTFSWHMCWCAADIRNRHYTPEQLRRVMEHIEQERNDSRWEILQHDVGAGNHIHIGRRDFDARRQFQSSQPKGSNP